MKIKHKHKKDTRQNLDIKSEFKSVDTGIKNGVFIFSAPLTVEEFAQKIGKTSSEILKYFFLKSKIMNLNSVLSEEEIGELCLEYNYDFEKRVTVDETNVLANIKVTDDPKLLKPRPPIVTIMGHVDHGKTTLLDYIRKSHVVKSEAGGITQHIGAYQIEHRKNKITFLDTPGHAAFTQMRARGAVVTDIVVIVIAADDGIKPQTQEAIDHAKAAKVPIVVFINKMDKPGVKPEQVMSQLADAGLNPEEWGGDVITIKGSALTGLNVDKLLDVILATAEINEYKANPNRLAMGVVIESNIDLGLGPVATILIKNGSLAKGDFMIAGSSYGRVRAMLDENLKEVLLAYPSQPVKIIGLSEPPTAGDRFVVSVNEQDIKDIAKKIKIHNTTLIRQAEATSRINLDPNSNNLNLILKTDVHGSLEAIRNMLSNMEAQKIKINLLRSAIGGINESDIQLAKASNAIIIGFNVKATKTIKSIADYENIKIYFYDIIYKLSEDVQDMLDNKLDPVYEEKETGEAIIQQL